MIGRTRKHFTTTQSTNSDARELIRQGAREGTVVTADFQTQGRGRRERNWISAHSESILASYILYPKRPMDEWGGLPLIASLAVVQAAKDATGLTAKLKWPNDVLINGRKLSGILVETGSGPPAWAVVGIGINVNQAAFEGDFRQQPTSVFLEIGKLSDIDTFLEQLSRALDAFYALWTDMGNPPVIEAWKQHSAMIGSPVRIDSGQGSTDAIALDMNPDGSLVVQYPDGTTGSVYAGDVTLSIGGK